MLKLGLMGFAGGSAEGVEREASRVSLLLPKRDLGGTEWKVVETESSVLNVFSFKC